MGISLKDLVSIGKITGVIDDKGFVQVTFEDKDDKVLEMPILAAEYNMPKMNDPVWCLVLGTEGLCLGKAYSSENPPPRQDKNIYHKPLISPDAFFEYDNTTKTMKLKAENLVLDGEVTGTKNISDISGSMAQMRGIYNDHNHPNGNNGSPTGKPTQHNRRQTVE